MHYLQRTRSVAIPASILVLLSLISLATAGPFRRRQPQTAARPTTTSPMQLTYPTTKKGDQVDDYHGTKIADPYRWLEDLDSDETRQWVEAQNKVTFGWLAHVPVREAI